MVLVYRAKRNDLLLCRLQHLGSQVFHQAPERFIRYINGGDHEFFSFVLGFQAQIRHLQCSQQQDAASHLPGGAQHRYILQSFFVIHGFGIWYLVLGIRYLVLGIRYWVLGIGY